VSFTAIPTRVLHAEAIRDLIAILRVLYRWALMERGYAARILRVVDPQPGI
jgi:hypothetical protein